QRIMAYTEIENCLMIGAYRDLAKNNGKKFIQYLVNQFTGKKFPVFSFAQSLYIPVCEPIFLKPLREQDIFDIIFDRTRVYMAIKLDNLIKMFDANGAKARWLSRKETDKILKESHLSKDILVYDNKAIAVELGGISMYLGNGVLGRIIFDNILPSSVASMNFHSLQEALGDKRQNQPVNSS
ncbi:hypothetical protein L0244_08810, partial [bacterium]|nr:hypothetical protein [bacterium]